MMKYFSIHNSLNEKIMGKIPQVKEVVHNCHVWDEPKFINKFPFKKIEIKPILSNAVLYPKSKQTDLIQISSIGFSNGSILISDKFKGLLEKFNCFGVQFFSTYLIHKNKKIESYWQTHVYDIPFSFLDFNRTSLFIKNAETRVINYDEELKVLSFEEFTRKKNSLEYPFSIVLKNVSFIDNMNLDYFFLRNFEGASNGIASEGLKIEIEKQGITGIEFKPIEVNLIDWLGSNGLREKFYGCIPQKRPDGSIRE